MAIYDDLDDRNSFRDRIERCKRDFEDTQNPLYAWEAWGVIRMTWLSPREESLEVPLWLSEYLDACGDRLFGLKPEANSVKRIAGICEPEDSPPKAKEGPGNYGRAFGFSKGLDVTREEWGGEYDRREHIALQVVELMWKEKLSLNAAAEQAQEKNWASRTKAIDAVKNAQRYALRFMQDRLKEAGEPVQKKEEVVGAFMNMGRKRAK